MPATAAEPEVRGFALSDFTNIPNPPPDDLPKTADDPPAQDTPPIPETNGVPDDLPEPEKKPAAEPAEPAETMEDVMARKPSKADDKAEEARKAADDAKAAADKLKAETPEPTRDADLSIEHGAHVHPTTRKRFDAVAQKAKAARDERDAAIAKAAELEKRALAAEERAKAAPAPKELEDKLKSYEERIRELDISQDPVLQQKYDSRIKTNEESIISTLKGQGFGSTKKEKADGTFEFVTEPAVMAAAVAKLTKDGLTLNNLHPYIEALEKAGLREEAAEIREAVMENKRLARDKKVEVDNWKGNYTQRIQERERVAKETQSNQAQVFRQHTEAALKTDVDKLAKDFAYINRPAEPLSTDAPATVKAKQAAIAEYDAVSKDVEAAVKAFDTNGVTPDKVLEVIGRINAAAIQSVLLKTRVLPRVMKEMTAQAARIKELETDLQKLRGAGQISRAHSSSPSAAREPGTGSGPAPVDIESALLAHRADT